MCDDAGMMRMSRRRFNAVCMLGAGGCVLGLDVWRGVAGQEVHRLLPHRAGDEPGKWSKEALYYSKTANGVRCTKCSNFCELKAGEAGKCRNRVNYKGTLYSIAYGNPCAVHIDPIEKKPLYHFLPSTRAFSIAAAGCNFRCLNCQNWQISQSSPKETQNRDMMPQSVVDQCAASRCESIAYTYSEPTTFYEYTLDTAQLARKRNIRSILKSNGYINEEPLRKLAAYLDAANIDLKCFDDALYQKLSSGRLAPVLKTLRTLKEAGVWLEITNLIIPGWTDDMNMIRNMSEWLVKNGLAECTLHFTRFSPLYKLTQVPMTPVPTLDKARDIAMKAGMKYVYVGNVPGHAAENTYCGKCRKMVIERKGFSILSTGIRNGKCKFCGEVIPGVWGKM